MVTELIQNISEIGKGSLSIDAFKFLEHLSFEFLGIIHLIEQGLPANHQVFVVLHLPDESTSSMPNRFTLSKLHIGGDSVI